MGWDGGRVGGGAESALAYIAGACAGLVTLAIAACGVALVLKPFMSSPRAVNAGATCVLAALLLAFAAGTAGLGPDAPPRQGYFDPDFLTEHGGVLGETLYWATTTLFQRIGAHIIAVLLLLAGLLLLSGSTVSGLLRSSAQAAGRARDGARGFATTVRETRAGGDEAETRVVDGEEVDGEHVLTRVASTEPIATELLGPEHGDAEDDAVEEGVDATPTPAPSSSPSRRRTAPARRCR